MKYPVLAFPFSGRTVVVANDQHLFEQATRSQLKAGFFKPPLRVVDSQGWAYVADAVHERGGVGPLGGWNLLLNRKIRIEMAFRGADEVSIQQLREDVKAALRDDPTGVWLGGELAPEDLCAKVDACSSVADVIELLS